MPKFRVYLGFTSDTDEVVEGTAGTVLQSLYGNPHFPDPPIAQPDLEAALDAFQKGIAEANQGGPADLAKRDRLRETLVDLLRELAGYVQSHHQDDLAILLSSGFKAVSRNRAQRELEPPSIRKIDNGMSGQLIVRTRAVANMKGYQVRYALIAADGSRGPWQDAGFFNSSRGMPVSDLIPGALYAFQARALGGSTGTSDWSDEMRHRSL